LAAFAAPAKPSAITATNRIALMLFMDFLLLENEKGSCGPMATPSAGKAGSLLSKETSGAKATRI
jgi:hypothetical protein